VVDADGTKIGSVEQIFTTADSGDPAFVTVRTGLFGMSETFVPLAGASLAESVIKVDFAKDKVKAGPRIDSDRGQITEAQEQELYAYYGLDTAGNSGSPAPASGAEDDGAAQPPEARPDSGTATPEGPPLPPAPPPHPGPPPPPHLRKHVPVPLSGHPHPGPHHPGPHHPGPPPGHRPPGLGTGPL
jgi:hypothetical protein